MRILDKYTIKSFIGPFLYVLGAFIVLYIIIDLFGHLDEILRNKIPILILEEYYLSMVPLIIIQTAPLAALISTNYILSRMQRLGEIIALRSSGINIYRVVAPFIFIGLIISVSVFLVSEKILPQSMKNAQSIKGRYINRPSEDKKAAQNIALYGKHNRLIFIEDYNRHKKTIKGVTILQQDAKGNVSLKISASEGKWQNDTWLFTNVLIYRLGPRGMILGQPVFFEKKTFSMESPKDLITKSIDYEFMTFKELSKYIENFSHTSSQITNKLKVDLHKKLSFPFTNLIIILIAVGFGLKIRIQGKAQVVIGMGGSLVVGFLYYTFMAASIAFGKGGVLSPLVSVHLGNVIFGLIGIMLIKN